VFDGGTLGGLVNDDCGDCGGDGVTAACSCNDTSGLNADGCCDDVTTDCDGTCGGSLVNDDCGECDGDGSTCDDCDGNNGAVTTLDDCGVCGGSGPLSTGCCDNETFTCNDQSGWTDSWGDDCSYYETYTSQCGYEDSASACCVCNGGSQVGNGDQKQQADAESSYPH
jgi:hypothetical protein